jgi:hypothetical protein
MEEGEGLEGVVEEVEVPGSRFRGNRWDGVLNTVMNNLSARKLRLQAIPQTKKTAKIDYQSALKQRLYDQIKHVVNVGAPGKVRMYTSHEFVFYLFECEFLIRLPGGGNEYLTLNIEIDQVHHWFQSKKFCSLRDEYLRKRGVTVGRLDSSTMTASCSSGWGTS